MDPIGAFTALFAPLTAWLDAHPGAVAWFMAWAAALGAAQAVKAVLLPPSLSVTTVKRITQVIAIAAGSAVAFYAWPNNEHRAVAALTAGMSAPTAYTFMRAVIQTIFPRLAANLSWQSIQSKSQGENP